MFGLEKKKDSDEGSKKGAGAAEFVFEWEKELRDLGYARKLADRIEGRIQMIKQVLRSGESPGMFDKYGVLLHGYTSLVKVMNRLRGNER